MATKEQFEFYQSLYREEENRSKELESRAKFYFSVISAFLGALILKATEFHSLIHTLHIPQSIIILETIFLFAALAFVVLGMTTRRYQSIANGSDIFRPDVVLTDEVFYDPRIADSYNNVISQIAM